MQNCSLENSGCFTRFSEVQHRHPPAPSQKSSSFLTLTNGLVITKPHALCVVWSHSVSSQLFLFLSSSSSFHLGRGDGFCTPHQSNHAPCSYTISNPSNDLRCLPPVTQDWGGGGAGNKMPSILCQIHSWWNGVWGDSQRYAEAQSAQRSKEAGRFIWKHFIASFFL